MSDTIYGVVSVAGGGPTTDGDDRLFGRSGNDSIWGDVGFISTSGTFIGGNDTIRDGNGDDRLFGDGPLFPGAPEIDYVGGSDDIRGGNGNDILNGNQGRDTLLSSDGNDILNGRKGKDILNAGDAKDVPNGGAGDDRMTGGAQTDRFVFSSGNDRITDFNAASNHEKIDLSSVNSIQIFQDLAANHTHQDSSNLVITSASGATLTLERLTIGDLDAGDFIF